MIDKVKQKLDSLSYLIDEETLDIEFIDQESFIIRGRITFVNGWELDFREFRSPEEHDYRFHLMDEEKGFLRRWDSAPHHDVETFPFHVHRNGEVEPSEEKNTAEILDNVEEIVLETYSKEDR